MNHAVKKCVVGAVLLCSAVWGGELVYRAQPGPRQVSDAELARILGAGYWDQCQVIQSCEQNYAQNGGKPPPGTSFVCWIGDDTTACYRCNHPSPTCANGTCTGSVWEWCNQRAGSCDCGFVFTGVCDGTGQCNLTTPTESHCGAFLFTCQP